MTWEILLGPVDYWWAWATLLFVALGIGAWEMLQQHGHTAASDGGTLTTAIRETGTWTTPARALDTIYQNTSGKKRRVMASFNFSDGTGDNQIHVEVGAANPPTTVAARVGGIPSTTGSGSRWAVSVEVPNNWYYRVKRAVQNGTISHTDWLELDE